MNTNTLHTQHAPRHRRPYPAGGLTTRLSQLDPVRLAEYRDNVTAAALLLPYELGR
jgi:hypothetical protein